MAESTLIYDAKPNKQNFCVNDMFFDLKLFKKLQSVDN